MKFKSDYKKGMAKEATQHITVEQILKTFEENHIACMPLKGYLVKYLYPQPDMRLMADVDILIKDEQAEQVKKLMMDFGFTVEHQGGNHDGTRKHAVISSINIRDGKKHSIRMAKHLYRLKLFFPPLRVC